MLATTTDPKARYLAGFERLGRKDARRRAAIDRFAELGFPTGTEENWRFTDLAPFLEVDFKPAATSDISLLRGLAQGPLKDLQMTFVDGVFSPELSSTARPDGLTLGSLAQVDVARYSDTAFAALNTALSQDGAYIHVRRGAQIAAPIHVLFLFSHGVEPFMVHPRVFILAEENSSAVVVESYIGPAGGVYFTNAVTEVVVREGASVDYTKVQRESLEAFHVAALQVRQERGSTFASHSISFGGRLVRADSGIVLDGEGADCTLNGLYEVSGRQVVDNQTTIDHVKPGGTSRELFKGILDGASRAVFDGKIIVRPGAQNTNAVQANKNLILSDAAVVHTKPQLEIFANDVKCRHGATIGRLDEGVLFYLRSRGIGKDDARRLLVHAFASEICDKVRVDSIRAQLGGCLAFMAPGGRS